MKTMKRLSSRRAGALCGSHANWSFRECGSSRVLDEERKGRLADSGLPSIDRRARRAGMRGIASIEAAIMLPLLCLVFAGVLYVNKLITNTQLAASTVRRCAWQVAASGCGNVPEDCPEVDREEDPALKNRMEEAGVTTSLAPERLESAGPVPEGSGVFEAFKDIAARLNELLLDRFEVSDEKEFERGELLGGETITVGRSFSLPCNVEPDSAEGIADKLFSGFAPEMKPEPKRLDE